MVRAAVRDHPHRSVDTTNETQSQASTGAAAPASHESDAAVMEAAVAAMEAASAARNAPAAEPATTETATDTTAEAAPAADQDGAAAAEGEAQADAAEAATPAPTEAQPETPERKRLIAAAEDLAKKQRATAVKERELRRKEAEIAEAAKSIEQFRALLASAKDNPAQFLAQVGLTPRDITTALLNEPKELTPEEATAAKLQAIERELAERKEREARAAEEAKAAQSRAEFEALSNRITQEIKSAGERYELINAGDEHQLVIDTMVAYFQANGEPCTFEAAADHVEKALEKRAEALAKTKKISARFAQVNAAPKIPLSNTNGTSPRANGTGTLTNRATTAAAPSSTDLSRLTDEQLVELAAKQLVWE